MAAERVVGHDRPLRVLRRSLGSGRVPHAYLFWGPDGIGKTRVAREVARALLCGEAGALARGEGCGACRSCRRLDSGNHPDLHVLVPRGARVGVEEVRALQESLSFRPFEGGRRVAIIPDAFRLTREASNALLKTLEEPPAGTHLVLTAHHRDQLLPTVVSRCQCVRFDPLPDGAVEQVLVSEGMEPEQARALARVCGGRPGRVLGREPGEFLEWVRQAEDLVDRWDGLTAGERLRLGAEWARVPDLRDRLETLQWVVRRRIRRLDGAVPAWLDRQAGLARVLEWMDRNVNTELALDALFLGLAGQDWEDRWLGS
ncbi:DNA polymerase III subunit delta' [Deferrisoma camini]|uniref:DNA polymerase III subunit delta' n=1 Tax=Deferrisoma camini TaxID=1035120 RepID=UPI00046CD205|nr:DNA polymerase III subunit delta' [Deferrisoma camini]